MSISSINLSSPDEFDKISRLPDDILLKFLSTLDLKNAAQTSILGTRWRYLWTWRTDLDLIPVNMSQDNAYSMSKKIGPQGYLKWIDQIVHAHRGSVISNFRFYFESRWSKDISQIEKWARFALSKRVENLDMRLSFSKDSSKFCLGFDILKDPQCYNGIVNLKSLRLSSVEVSGETLEFILSQCHLLEQLYVDCSNALHTLNIVSYTLKHLSLSYCSDLKELEIDAVNLISFRYEDQHYCTDGLRSVRTRMVFKSVPKLVEIGFAGNGCTYPFPILGKISDLHNQLTSLYVSPTISVNEYLGKCSKGSWEIDMHFPNVKQLTFAIRFLCRAVFQFVKSLMNACPMLHELNIQVDASSSNLRQEAKQLRGIELVDERMDEMSKDQNSYPWAQKEQAVNHVEGDEYANKNPNLKVLEVFNFRGCHSDVYSALDIIAAAQSIEKLICNPRTINSDSAYWAREPVVELLDNIERRARKLAKVVPPNVHVGVRYKSGLLWIS